MEMLNFCDLYYKSNIYKIIDEDKKQGMLNHAYLFCAKDSLCANYITHSVAQHIMCNKDVLDLHCPICEKINHGNHVDVKVYPRKGDVILVDDISDILTEAYIKPTTCDIKIFVLQNFDKIGVLSQNKLLKTLEEPPVGVIFLLSCINQDLVLDTIKSRTKVCDVVDFGNEDINTFIKANVDNINKDFDVDDAMGSLDRAYKIAKDEKFQDIKRLAKDIVCELTSSQDALEYSKRVLDVKEVDTLCDEIVLILGDVIKTLLGVSKNAKYQSIIANYTPRMAHKLMTIALDYKRKYLASGNVTVLADSMIMDILEAKYLCRKL